MKYSATVCGFALLASSIIGCGESPVEGPGAAVSTTASTSTAKVSTTVDNHLGAGGQASADGSSSSLPAELAQNPVAVVANKFIHALTQGNTEEATKHLTAKSIESMKPFRELFHLGGEGIKGYQINRVQKQSDTIAGVQCVLISKNPKEANEEISCLLKLVNNHWQVFGIAMDISENSNEIAMLNYEQPLVFLEEQVKRLEKNNTKEKRRQQQLVKQPVVQQEPAARTANNRPETNPIK